MKYLISLINSTFILILLSLVINQNKAICQPVGDTYSVSGVNFPNTYGPVSINFDLSPKNVGGMIINESYLPVDGISGGITATNIQGANVTLNAWANCGDLLELSWDTTSGGFIGGTSGFGSVSSFSINDLNIGSDQQIFRSGIFIYIKRSGSPATYLPDPAVIEDPNSIAIGDHPLLPETKVVFLNLTSSQLLSLFSLENENLSGSFITSFFGPDVGFLEIAYALGLLDFSDFFGSIQRLNGLSLGMLISQNLTGDIDEDGVVGISDLAIIQANLGRTGVGLPGDINGDGSVTRLDAAILSAHFGKSRVCDELAPSQAFNQQPIGRFHTDRSASRTITTNAIQSNKKLYPRILNSRKIQIEIRKKLNQYKVKLNRKHRLKLRIKS